MNPRHRIPRVVTSVAVSVAAAALAVGGASVASADPSGPTLVQGSPVAVYQIPPTGLAGFGPWSGSVAARDLGGGAVAFSVDSICTPAVGSFRIRVDWTNLATGARGVADPQICNRAGDVVSQGDPQVARTGAGPVVFTAAVAGGFDTGSLVALPGAGGFVVP